MEKEIKKLKQKLANANDFIKDIASLLEIETDGIGFDELQLSIDDFDEAICALGEKTYASGNTLPIDGVMQQSELLNDFLVKLRRLLNFTHSKPLPKYVEYYFKGIL